MHYSLRKLMEGVHTNGRIDNKLQDCQNETLLISEMKYTQKYKLT